MTVGVSGSDVRGIRTANRRGRAEEERGALLPRSLLVCFSGKIGSGKTSISGAVAHRLGCGCSSFGSYLRDTIEQRGGDPDCRRSLQDLGKRRIERDPESFCRDVLAGGGFVPGEDYVLDGVRHVDVLPHLIGIAAPSAVRLIFLDADAGLRLNRVGERSAGAREDFDRAAGHAVEADMEDGVPSAADATVDGSAPEREVVEVCMALIEGWRRAGPETGSRCEIPAAGGGTQTR